MSATSDVGEPGGTPRPRSRRDALRLLRTLTVVTVGAAACASEPFPAQAAPRPAPAVRPLRPIAQWQKAFDSDEGAGSADDLRLSRSTDSWDFYTLSYSIDAVTSMYVATGDGHYADLGLTYAGNMIASARPSSSLPSSSFQDRYLGWASSKAGDDGDEVPLYESYAWRYVTKLLRAMKDRKLATDPAYAPRYDRALAFTETEIFDKWFARGPNSFIYRERTHMAAHWALISLDLSRLTADGGRRTRCADVVTKIDRDLPNYPSSLRGQLRPNPSAPDAYWWSDVWGAHGGRAQDVAHGNGVMAYVVEAHELGSEWTDDDMARFTRTLTAFVLRTGGHHPGYVDGTGSDNGWLADGFVKLGRYDPAVQAALETYDVQNSQYFAAMAENAHWLGRVTGR